MKVAVIGTGHVGLVTGAALSHLGHEVACVDVDAEKIARLRRGVTPFFEEGLSDLLADGLGSGRLRFEADPSLVVPGAEAVFICVGTPTNADGEANLLAVERSAIDVALHATDRVVVVEKSTVPAGTADRVKVTLRKTRPDVEFHVVSNPEFLSEGSALRDSLEPDRILVGADSETGFETMRRLYEPLTREGRLLIETDVRTAELAKHACNAFLALKISYANALARVCELAGADVTAVTAAMGSDPRIGSAFLGAGLGYGGYCFPKDVPAFQNLAERLGYPFPLLSEIVRINDEALDAAVEKIREVVWNLPGKRIALLGLAYKPQTDDVRFSPALALARKILELGADVAGYDPEAATNAEREVPGLEIAADPYEAATGAHCLVLATAWNEFRELDLARLREEMAHAVVVDGRNFLDPEALVRAGFEYHPAGRPPIVPAGSEA